MPFPSILIGYPILIAMYCPKYLVVSEILLIAMIEIDLTNMVICVKGIVMQIEKVLMNDCSRVSKVSWKFRILAIYNFTVIYLWNLLFS